MPSGYDSCQRQLFGAFNFCGGNRDTVPFLQYIVARNGLTIDPKHREPLARALMGQGADVADVTDEEVPF